MRTDVGGQICSIVFGAIRGVHGRHGDAPDVLAAAGIGGHSGHQRGIDAAGKSQRHTVEMVLGHVILEAKHASGVHLFVRVKFGHDSGFGLMVGSGVKIPEREVFHKHRAALEQRTVRIYHEATAVEHQIILTAHLIQINKRSVDLGSTALRQFKTSVGLAFLIRRAINGQQQVDVFGGEFSHRAAVLPIVVPFTSRVTERFPAEKMRNSSNTP